jgi:hypothetical protein
MGSGALKIGRMSKQRTMCIGHERGVFFHLMYISICYISY